MYFNLLPNINYKLPSNHESMIVKNLFVKYNINKDITINENVFDKYYIKPGETLQSIALYYYGDQFYDWVIILLNQITNPNFQIPLNQEELIMNIKKEQKNPSDIAYCVDKNNVKHDKKNLEITHIRNINNQRVEVPGSEIFTPVTYIEQEIKLNEQRSIIYLIKKAFFRSFVDDFEREIDKLSI